jgi:hypothetical protein
METLSATDLKNLVQTAFPPLPGDSGLAILVDVPDAGQDHPQWRQRRQIAAAWFGALKSCQADLNLERLSLIFYPNVHNNNADLPAFGFQTDLPVETLTSDQLTGEKIPFPKIFEQHQIFLAPTEFSATAPLKLAAKKYPFRAATMPGFTPEMLPALKLDYAEISRRVDLLKSLVDAADRAEIVFRLDLETELRLALDLRFRHGHASSGLFPEKGVAGNLPSGECYIVPYEGERGEVSQSHGLLPVQFRDEVVIYRIEQNRAVGVTSVGEISRAEAEKLRREPAYGNLAELGFGVLADFGIQPIGSVLLDEKLGLHIAFGRSDHFGGAVGVKDFSSLAAVEHSDRIYLPETQPRIQVKRLSLHFPDGDEKNVLADGQYLIFDKRVV